MRLISRDLIVLIRAFEVKEYNFSGTKSSVFIFSLLPFEVEGSGCGHYVFAPLITTHRRTCEIVLGLRDFHLVFH